MYSMIFLAIASFGLSLFLTPLFRNLALRLNLLDLPDHRKIHKVPIPRVGGVAIFVSAAGAFGLLLVFRLKAGLIIWAGAPFAVRLLPAVLTIFCVGLVDDIFQVRPLYKLAGQILGAVMAWCSGIHLSSIGGHDLPLVLSFALTTVWIVACCNAVNLIDGVDGLAAGVSLFAVITTLIAALFHHNIDLALATAPLAGALFGFLRFNFSPASIFLGDCGSLTLGFLLGCYGVVWSEKSTTLLSMIAPLMVLFVPLLDVFLAIIRRFIHKQPIFAADRGHIHHKLLSRGLPPRQVVLILYGFCGLAAVAGLMLTATHVQYHSFVVIVVILAAWLGIQHLDYTEFGVVSRLVFGGGFHRLLNAQLSLAQFEGEIARSKTLDNAWELLCRQSSAFGFSGIELELDNEKRIKWANSCWQIRIEFPGRGHVIFIRERGAGSDASEGVLFVDCVERVLMRKLEETEPRRSDVPAYAQAR
jgi:UDP-GlcNAc:undecaprenyl-phosphate/decaprenyl-phosphate GlcNAc-1-phosphate transferase